MTGASALNYLVTAIQIMNLKQVKRLTQHITMEELRAIGRIDKSAEEKVIKANAARATTAE